MLPQRRGLTLSEVMISVVVLALGLVGLAAVFPAVISQQQSATDVKHAQTVAASADAVLATRLPQFRAGFNDPEVVRNIRTRWHAINAFNNAGIIYLRAPWPSPRTPREPELRLRERATFTPEQGQHRQGVWVYETFLPRWPLHPEQPEVKVIVEHENEVFELVSDEDRFVPGENAQGRLVPGQPNEIFPGGPQRRAQLHFHFRGGSSTPRSVTIEYTWLNERIVSHADRLYPSGSPRYGWEMAYRRTRDGQMQYCVFVYRFDGPIDLDFVLARPGRLSDMLRTGPARVESDGDRVLLRTGVSGGLADHIEPGVWLLPVHGTNPVRVRREVRRDARGQPLDNTWELEGPTLTIDEQTGAVRPLVGNVEFWYLPLEIPAINDQGREIGTWRIRPIHAAAKQVEL